MEYDHGDSFAFDFEPNGFIYFLHKFHGLGSGNEERLVGYTLTDATTLGDFLI